MFKQGHFITLISELDGKDIRNLKVVHILKILFMFQSFLTKFFLLSKESDKRHNVLGLVTWQR